MYTTSTSNLKRNPRQDADLHHTENMAWLNNQEWTTVPRPSSNPRKSIEETIPTILVYGWVTTPSFCLETVRTVVGGPWRWQHGREKPSRADGNPWGKTMELIPRLRGGLFTSTKQSWKIAEAWNSLDAARNQTSLGCNNHTATHKLWNWQGTGHAGVADIKGPQCCSPAPCPRITTKCNRRTAGLAWRTSLSQKRQMASTSSSMQSLCTRDVDCGQGHRKTAHTNEHQNEYTPGEHAELPIDRALRRGGGHTHS